MKIGFYWKQADPAIAHVELATHIEAQASKQGKKRRIC